jgi:branched-chain amino acid transport system substrate-binding protein
MATTVNGQTMVMTVVGARLPRHARATTSPEIPEENCAMSYRSGLLAIGCALAFSAPAAAQKYDVGATDAEIKIGNTSAYSGPASSYGTIGKAASAYFDMINEKGGVNGRRIKFISLDDGYSPPKTVEQVRRLIEQDQVLFLFNNLGTAPNIAIHKYTNAKKVPLIFVGSGSRKWADPEHFPWTIGWWPSYLTEGAIFGRYIKENVPNPKLAIMSQNDDAGREYTEGLKMGLGSDARSIIVAEATFESTDATVDSQVISLKSSGANVFFNGGTPKFVAQAIRKANDLDWKPIEIIPSVASSVKATLEPAGLEISKGLITAQYIKDPTDKTWNEDPEVLEWRAFMDKYYPGGSKSDYSNVYAAAVSASLIQVLQQAGDTLTRENIMRQAASLKDVHIPLLLPGIRLNTSPTDFSPIEQMQLAKFNGKNWELFGSLIDGRK